MEKSFRRASPSGFRTPDSVFPIPDSGLRIPFSGFRFLLLLAAAGCLASAARAADDSAFALVDQTPLRHSQLDELLGRRFPDRDPAELPAAVRRAAAVVLVRRELAAQRLLEIGGESHEALVRRAVERQEGMLQRRGESIDAWAARQGTTAEALRANWRWETLWAEAGRSFLSDEALRRFYETHRWRYDGSRAHVSQIFTAPPPSDPANASAADSGAGLDWEAALEQLEALRQRIAAGELSFAEAATEHSQAPSAAQGGRLGWVEAVGDLPPAVAQAAFTAPLRTATGPIRSSRGIHLVWVEERQTGEGDFDSLVPMRRLRRDAANALLDRLAAERAKQTTVQWLDEALFKSPEGVKINRINPSRALSSGEP